MTALLIVLIALVIALLFSWKGRRNHKGLNKLQGWYYAHRGLHGSSVPESSMAAFRTALEAGYGIELDVHLMKDGNLAVIHDSLLKRTTGFDGIIEDLTVEQLKNFHLEGTKEVIPEFRQVLELFSGKAPMIIELKSSQNNYAVLTETVCRVMEDYEGAYCIESFDPRCILWLRKHRPDIVRGQLAENFLLSKSNSLPYLLKLAMTSLVTNFLTQPDFIAYKFKDRKRLSVWLSRKLWGIQGVAWTLRNKQEFDVALKEDWLPIFEGFRP